MRVYPGDITSPSGINIKNAANILNNK